MPSVLDTTCVYVSSIDGIQRTKIGKPGSQPILPSFLFVIRDERNNIKILVR